MQKALNNQSDDIIPVFITNRKYLDNFLIPNVRNDIFENSNIFMINDDHNIIVIPDYYDASFEIDKLGELEKKIKCKLELLYILYLY